MTISAVSGSQSGSIQVGQSSQSTDTQIKALEKQKQQIQEQINKINQDKQTKAEDKQKQVQLLQNQIQTLDAQIQQLEQRQSESGSNQQGGTAAASKQSSIEQQLARQSIDIQV